MKEIHRPTWTDPDRALACCVFSTFANLLTSFTAAATSKPVLPLCCWKSSLAHGLAGVTGTAEGAFAQLVHKGNGWTTRTTWTELGLFYGQDAVWDLTSLFLLTWPVLWWSPQTTGSTYLLQSLLGDSQMSNNPDFLFYFSLYHQKNTSLPRDLV